MKVFRLLGLSHEAARHSEGQSHRCRLPWPGVLKVMGWGVGGYSSPFSSDSNSTPGGSSQGVSCTAKSSNREPDSIRGVCRAGTCKAGEIQEKVSEGIRIPGLHGGRGAGAK